MNIILKCLDSKYQMHYMEYMAIWKNEGSKIIEAIEGTLGLKFKEKEIVINICEGYQNKGNFFGNDVSEQMVFRYNNRCKIGTFFHELSHRIIMEYKLFDIINEKYKLNNEHQLIDLFLYDSIEKAYGKEAAQLRVDYEKEFPEKEFKESWEYALSMDCEKRKKLLKEIVKNV